MSVDQLLSADRITKSGFNHHAERVKATEKRVTLVNTSLFGDITQALAWAVAAATLGVVMTLSGFVHGLIPIVLPLAVAPFLAYRWHGSKRVAWLVASWEAVLVASAVVLLLWVFRDFQFRAIQG